MANAPPPIFSLQRGHRPVLVSVPHSGRYLPPAVKRQLADGSGALPDTDHFVDQLYSFATELGVSLLVARWSRWFIDLNRPPDNRPLYPGQAGTGLVPTTRFDGEPIWAAGCNPDGAEVHRRLHQGWVPYHAALGAELTRIRDRFGHVVLWDAHSIQSSVPRLFDGTLPDLNLGTHSGGACHPALREQVSDRLASLSGWSHVVDGRFKGGHITRHYGRPEQSVHALQLEVVQSAYMDEHARPVEWSASRAARLQADIRGLIDAVAEWRP